LTTSARVEVALEADGVVVSKVPTRVRSTVGTSVTVCLYDPVVRVGGIRQLMAVRRPPLSFIDADGKRCMDSLLEDLDRHGAFILRLQAKLFGASRILEPPDDRLAEDTCAFVRGYLRDHGIAVVAEKLGRDCALQIVFETHTGRAFVRELSPVHTAIVEGTDLASAGLVERG
jgi:chemotaxis protein CheD